MHHMRPHVGGLELAPFGRLPSMAVGDAAVPRSGACWLACWLACMHGAARGSAAVSRAESDETGLRPQPSAQGSTVRATTDYRSYNYSRTTRRHSNQRRDTRAG
eukprot:975871-Prymnesium_polylepis.2